MLVTVELVGALWGVRLTATGYTGTVTWWEDEGPANRLIGTGPVLVDRMARLNRPLNYFATDDTSTVVADPVTVPADRPILASTTTQEAVAVEVLNARPYEGEGRSTAHMVLGRSDPLVSIQPALYPGGDLELLARTPAQRVRLIELLRRGDPLHLRTTDEARLDTMTLLMRRWSDPYLNEDARNGPAAIRVEYQRVTDVPALSPPVPDRTYATVAADYLTYADLVTTYASYTDLLDGTPR